MIINWKKEVLFCVIIFPMFVMMEIVAEYNIYLVPLASVVPFMAGQIWAEEKKKFNRAAQNSAERASR